MTNQSISTCIRICCVKIQIDVFCTENVKKKE